MGRLLSLPRVRRVLPGFGLSMGITLTYLSLLVLIPLSTIFLKSATLGLGSVTLFGLAYMASLVTYQVAVALGAG